MMLVQMNSLEKYWGDRLIFRTLEPFRFYRGEKVGIVGRNGAGKTTLLHMLAGLADPDQGTVTRFGPCAIIQQLDEESAGASTRSGGEKTRERIAEALSQKPAILLADEPTSHLDLEGIAMVERELLSFQGLVIVISHDRELLDRVCTKILEIENGKVSLYTGSYTSYREQKERESDRARFEYEQYASEKERLTAAIREREDRSAGMRKPPKRMSAKEARLGSEKARQKQGRVQGAAKSLEKRLEMLKQVEKPREIPEVRFDLNGFRPVYGKTVVRLEKVGKRFGSRVLFEELTTAIKPGAKVALIGPNGAGKSTLLGMMLHGEEGVTVAPAARVGYFHQELVQLDDHRTLLENVLTDSPYPEVLVRTVLARLLFRGEEVMKPAGVLSGGEKVKAALAKVFLNGCNLMLLDEPTNYLDIGTREELEHVLEAYPGTIIFASHDRRLIGKLATQLLVWETDGVRFYNGTYEEYAEETRKRQQAEEEPGMKGIEPEPQARKMEEREGELSPLSKEEARLQAELEMAEVLGRLSLPRSGDVPDEWEERYRRLLSRLKELRG